MFLLLEYLVGGDERKSWHEKFTNCEWHQVQPDLIKARFARNAISFLNFEDTASDHGGVVVYGEEAGDAALWGVWLTAPCCLSCRD